MYLSILDGITVSLYCLLTSLLCFFFNSKLFALFSDFAFTYISKSVHQKFLKNIVKNTWKCFEIIECMKICWIHLLNWEQPFLTVCLLTQWASLFIQFICTSVDFYIYFTNKNITFWVRFLINFFNWRKIALQCCDGFCCTTTQNSHNYTCITSLPPPSRPSGPSQSIWLVPCVI